MQVSEIVFAYLKEKNAVGLFNPGICGCGIDDLAPCGDMQNDCEVATTIFSCPTHGKLYGGPKSNNFCDECADE